MLTGSHHSGITTIIDFLHGRAKILGGKVYIEECVPPSFTKYISEDLGVIVIDKNQKLAEGLSVSDNIFLVQRGRKRSFLYQPRIVMHETMSVIGEVGLACAPNEKVYNLSLLEQFLLLISKAVTEKAKILIFDMTETSFNQTELLRLMQVIQKLQKQGLSFLLICEDPGCLSVICDKVVIMYAGRDVKTLFKDNNTKKDIMSVLKNYPDQNRKAMNIETVSFRDSVLHSTFRCVRNMGDTLFEINRGQVLGFVDNDSIERRDFNLYLKIFISKNNVQFQHDGKPVYFWGKGVVYIPENSGELLHHNLSLEDLLLLPKYPSITSPFGIINKKILMRAKEDFFVQFGIAREVAFVEQLTRLQKRLLSIWRWVITNPMILIIENPFYGLDLMEQKYMIDYFAELAKGNLFILFSYNSVGNFPLHHVSIVHTTDAVFDYLVEF